MKVKILPHHEEADRKRLKERIFDMIFYSFEDIIPPQLEASSRDNVTISREHSRDGESSLRWDTAGDGFLRFHTMIPFAPLDMRSQSKALDSFVFWIYCDVKTEGSLRVDFLKKGNLCCGFDFFLGFTGWRTAWVSYERDMEGNPEADMDEIRITAKVDKKCVLYLDQMIPLTKIDPRYHTPDFQVPNIHKKVNESANAHWLSLLKFWRQQEEGLRNGKKADGADIEAISVIASRFQEYLLRRLGAVIQMEEIRSRLSKFELDCPHGGRRVSWNLAIDGYPEESREQLLALTNALDFRQSGILLKDMANLWHHTKESAILKELEEGFVSLFLHLQRQGYACGSGIGTIHHSGYQMREYYHALFLMREVLDRQGILQIAADTVCWFCGSGRAFGPEEEIKRESLDTFNTLSQGILAGALMQEEAEDAHEILLGIKRWLSSCMLPAPGLEGPFKSDSCMFHHANHYPAYAMGGLTGIVPVVYCISRTRYRVDEKAHQCLKDSILAFRLYCNHLQWPVSLAARHPLGSSEHSGIGTLSAFQYLALSGSPDGREEVDREVAGAYMRLRPYVTEADSMEFDIAPEEAPEGHWNLNYGCIALHRREEWLAAVRGFSRYIWGNESYVANNLYGRYIAYGQLQLLNKGNPVTNEESGFVHDGWNWNFWPGTTAIALPFESLRADVRNVDTFSGFEEMLISDETYCGGTGLDGNGVFAMKLHEHGKYNGSHRARKSYFFLEDMIICLGSDIENTSEYPTFTTIFQTHRKTGENIGIQGERISSFPYEKVMETTEKLLLEDTKGNGYYIPPGQKIEVSVGHQVSCSQSDGKLTEGDFATAVLCHGNSPLGAGYEYAVLVNGAGSVSQRFAQEAPYEVLRKDTQVHIIRRKGKREIYYACFEPVEGLDFGLLNGADTPCLVIEKQQGSHVVFAVCDPDLGLYEGVEPDQADEEGNQVEVSLYSRKWFGAESRHHMLQLTLNDGRKREIDCFEARTVRFEIDTTIP